MLLSGKPCCRLRPDVLGLLACLLLMSACSRPSPSVFPAGSAGENGRVVVEGVPFYPQRDFLCGPASLAMMLNWSGMPVSVEELIPETYTPAREGSLQSALIAGTRRHGRIAYPINGMDMLFAEIDAGRPVLVLLNLSFSWFPRWHYAVVYGYDKREKLIFMHSGTTAHERFSFRVFNNTWARSGFWGLLVLLPSEMPVRVEVSPWLDAAAGLEAAGQWRAAATAFNRAVERWPGNHNAWIGLGNNRFALQDMEGAAAAFEGAIRIRPQSGVAHNNLAQVFAAMGRYEEALAEARKAVGIGGPFLEKFLETEREVRFEAEQSVPGSSL